MNEDPLWYFAYGSNLDPDRFRSRVGDWHDQRRAILEGYELRFSGEVSSEGGGGAIIQQAPGARVYGGVYRISRAQLEAMDQVELHSPMNANQRGTRHTVTVRSQETSLDAEIYIVPEPKIYRAPSAAYLGHITRGLRAFGYQESVIAEVETQAAREPVD